MYPSKRLLKQNVSYGLSILGLLSLTACFHQLDVSVNKRVVAKPSPNPSGSPTADPSADDRLAADLLRDYPDEQQRSVEAFKRSIYPVFRNSCSGCHSVASPSEARGRPHSDIDPKVAHDSAVDQHSFFNFELPDESPVLHLGSHTGGPFSGISGSPEQNPNRWQREIRRFVKLRSIQVDNSLIEDRITGQVRYNAVTAGIVGNVNLGIPRPGGQQILDLRTVVKADGNNPIPNYLISLQYNLRVENGAYRISELRLKSDARTHRAVFDGIEIALNGAVEGSASGFKRRYVVEFSDERASTGEVFSLPTESAVLRASEDLTRTDKIGFRFLNLHWEARPMPSPTATSTPTTDYRIARRTAAMNVIRATCSGCHGLGGTGGGRAFPNPATSTDQDWIGGNWVVSGSPQTSLLLGRLSLGAAANGYPTNIMAVQGRNRDMPQGRPALSLAQIWTLYDWVLLMGQSDSRTFRFAVDVSDAATPPQCAPWNNSTASTADPSKDPIRLRVGDTLFVRNLDPFLHEWHTFNNKPTAHWGAGSGIIGAKGCGVNVNNDLQCGFTRVGMANVVNTIPGGTDNGADSVYEHTCNMNGAMNARVYIRVD